MRTHDSAVLAALLALAVTVQAAALGCGGSSSKDSTRPSPVQAKAEAPAPKPAEQAAAPVLPPIPDTPQLAPDSLLAVAAVAHPAAQWDAIRDYADLVSPGARNLLNAGMMMPFLGSLVGAKSLAGIDMEKPIHILALDPTRFAAGPFVLVAQVSDEGALQDSLASTPEVRMQMHAGAVALGSAQALLEGAPYALTTLRTEPAPAQPTVTVLMPAVMALYGAQIAGAMAMVTAALENDPDNAQARQLLQYLNAALGDSAALQVSLEVQNAGATGRIVLVPAPSTPFATFAAKQAPSGFELIERLSPGSFLVAGRGDLFPSTPQDRRIDLQRLITALSTFMPAENAAAIAELMETLANYQKHEIIAQNVAFTGSISKAGDTRLEMLYAVSDPAKLATANAQFLAALSKKKLDQPWFRVKIRRNAFRHRGVAANGLSVTLSKEIPPEIRETMLSYTGKEVVDWAWAEFDGLAAGAISADGFAKVKSIIERVKDKRAAPSDRGAAAVIADAKARKESLVMAFDLGTIIGGLGLAPGSVSDSGWTVLGLGFADSVLSFRLTVPAATVRTFVELSNATGALPAP